jgi:hypothetical protein
MPNWEVYQVSLDLASDGRRATVVWNADPRLACVGIKKNGTGVRVLDKRGALQLEPPERDGWWWLSLAPATAHAPGDPEGYFFIGGDPLLLLEDGVRPSTPVVEPATGCSVSNGTLTLERGMLLSVSPAGGQTVRRGQPAEFSLRTRGLGGVSGPVSLRLVEWSTQRFPTPKPSASLPLRVILPDPPQLGSKAELRVETGGAEPGIYYVAVEASADGIQKRVEFALVVE